MATTANKRLVTVDDRQRMTDGVQRTTDNKQLSMEMTE
jgi:hypothetical protein